MKEYNLFYNKISSLKLKLEELSSTFKEQRHRFTDDELEKYISMDRQYPYEDISSNRM